MATDGWGHVGQQGSDSKETVSAYLGEVPADRSSFPVPSHYRESQKLTVIYLQCSFSLHNNSSSFTRTGLCWQDRSPIYSHYKLAMLAA